MGRNKLTPIYVIVLAAGIFYNGYVISGENKSQPGDWEKWEQSLDKKSLARSEKVVTDKSEKFIVLPKDFPYVPDFDIAKEPPAVDFGIVQGYEPWYLPVLYQDSYKTGGIWEGYGDVTKGPDGCFYYSIGDHRSYGGDAYVFRYDPKTKLNKVFIDLRKSFGWKPDEYIDSKVHGGMDIYPNGDLWFLTYLGPFPTKEEWDTVYRGSWLVYCNIYSGAVKNLGIPVEGATWPYFGTDTERNLLFAVDEQGGIVMAYDTKENKILYAGKPKNDINWFRRCTMLDKETGYWYSSDTKTYSDGERYRGEQHIVCYTRRNNEFIKMNSVVPANPVTGKVGPIRAHTAEKDDSGAFWCCSDNGTLFKFYPSEDSTAVAGINFGKEGIYCPNMSFSPKKRYIYYIPGANRGGFEYGTPVIQYDTVKNRKKVIAFLRDFYLDKYGYGVSGTYGIELDEKGETLFFYSGGAYRTIKDDSQFRRPGLFCIHIPESERIE